MIIWHTMLEMNVGIIMTNGKVQMTKVKVQAAKKKYKPNNAKEY